MKKLLVCLCAIFVSVASATTVNLNWTVEGNPYAQTTCETGGNLTLPAQAPTKYGYTFQGWYMNDTVIYGTGSQTGTPTPTNPIEPVWYRNGNLVLRALSENFGDSYSTVTGKITRRVGVKVLDGTEKLNVGYVTYIKSDAFDVFIMINDVRTDDAYLSLCNQAKFSSGNIWQSTGYSNRFKFNGLQFHINLANDVLGISDYTQEDIDSARAKMRSYLAQQYANGTPVTVYYPLAEPVEEYYDEQLN